MPENWALFGQGRPRYGSAMGAFRRLAGRSRNRVFDSVMLQRRQRQFLEDVRTASKPVKVHVGAGRHRLAGWIDTDIQWRCAAHLDITEPWPVPPGSIDYVYGDNVIEHLTLEQGRRAFQHTFDALAPGGVLRLSTPDVEASARSYLENGDLARAGIERNRELGKDFSHPVQLLAQVYVGAAHYLGFCYDYAALAAEMSAVGFEVSRCETGQSAYPELRDLELRTHAAEAATQLCVEGVKPRR